MAKEKTPQELRDELLKAEKDIGELDQEIINTLLYKRDTLVLKQEDATNEYLERLGISCNENDILHHAEYVEDGKGSKEVWFSSIDKMSNDPPKWTKNAKFKKMYMNMRKLFFDDTTASCRLFDFVNLKYTTGGFEYQFFNGTVLMTIYIPLIGSSLIDRKRSNHRYTRTMIFNKFTVSYELPLSNRVCETTLAQTTDPDIVRKWVLFLSRYQPTPKSKDENEWDESDDLEYELNKKIEKKFGDFEIYGNMDRNGMDDKDAFNLYDTVLTLCGVAENKLYGRDYNYPFY